MHNGVLDESIKHVFDLFVEGGIVKVVDLNGLEIFLRIKVAFGNQKTLPEDKFLNEFQ